jgi:hypothetical protein
LDVLRRLASDDDNGRLHEVLDGGAFAEKLGIGGKSQPGGAEHGKD